MSAAKLSWAQVQQKKRSIRDEKAAIRCDVVHLERLLSNHKFGTEESIKWREKLHELKQRDQELDKERAELPKFS